jgi:Domain of unknown function (DUF4118)
VVIMLASAVPSNPGHPHRGRRDRAKSFAVGIRPVAILAAAVILPIALTLALIPFRSQLPDATVALALAVLVSLLAAIGTRITAVIAAVSAAACFDIGFTQPYGSLTISHPQDIETTALLLVGGLIVGQLSARNQRHRGLAVRQSDDLARIQAIAELMAGGAEPDVVVAAVAEEIRDLLGLRACRFETSLPDRPGPVIDRNGNVSWGRIWWGVDTLGLPGKEIAIEVEHDQRRLGRFVLIAEPGSRVRHDQLVAAATLADQAGAALGAVPLVRMEQR